MVKASTAGKVAAGFGAAVASIYAAPELSADVVGINFNPGSVNFTSSSTLRTVSISSTASSAFVGGFGQWNDSIGKTIYSDGNMESFKIASAGEVLNTSTFSGSGGIGFSGSQSGTFYIGFKQTAANGGGVGWFSISLGGFGGTVVYGTDGQFGNDGESVTVGASAVPEPGTAGLAALALGAVGLRRRRRAINN
ncbi:MAG: PEP-CTERM sorting domain-containing protein [Pirellulaceae bacterium]|nr:PEP-CTERM sorting domain-containing protein [Pirellulaceae bacterium]MDG2102610.1 PEP-CTERM sorting domain-containing protein [Pirellulaceae bacterium]